MNFKHEISPSKPLLRSTQSLILGINSILDIYIFLALRQPNNLFRYLNTLANIAMILKVSSTISSDTEDDFNSSTEAKGGGAIGLRNAASVTPASESLTKDLSAASTDSGLSSQKSSISSTDSDTTRSKYEASSSSEKNPSNDNNVTGYSF